MLRHSAAHLLAEAVRRLYPGVKIAIGPPIENGFYYDFEFPEPIREDDLEKIEAEIQRELKEGRSWEREEISAEEAKQRFAAEGEPYKVELVDTAEGEISLYTQGDFTDLCRGPHLQDSKPIKAIKLTSLAGAYWRGDEQNTQLTRIYGTAFYSQADLDAYLERLEQAKARDHRRLGRELDLFHLSEESPGSPFWHPKGMVIWNELEDLRRRENKKRGYNEVKTPLIYEKTVWQTSGHWDKFRENMFLVVTDDDPDPHAGLKPMNCPGHMLLFGSRLRSYRDLPIRYAESSTLHRNELAGALHGLLRVRHVTQDDAHIFCTEEQAAAEIDALHRVRQGPLRALRRHPARGAVDAARQPARHGGGVGPRGGDPPGGARAARDRIRDQPGRGNLLRPEDRPAHERRDRPDLADGDDPGRLPDARGSSASPTWAPTTPSTRRWSSTAPCSARSSGSSASSPSTTRGAFPFWLAPVQVRLIPVAENHREAVQELRRAARDRGLPRRRRPARGDAREADSRGRAGEDPLHDRLRRPRVGRVARGAGARRRAVDAEPLGAARTVPGRACYDPVLKEGADHCPSPSRAESPRGFNRAGWTRKRGRCLQRFLSSIEEDSTSLVKSL